MHLLFFAANRATESISSALADDAWTIVWAQGSPTAVSQTIPEQSFAAILIDLSEGQADGIVTVSEARQSWPGQPIIVGIAAGQDALLAQAISAGADDYFQWRAGCSSSIATAIRAAQSRHSTSAAHRHDVRAIETQAVSSLSHRVAEFAGHVSHSLRTPLTVIKEYASLLQEGVVGPVNDQQQRICRVMEDRADDLHLLMENVLLAGKLYSHTLGAMRRRAEIPDLLNAALPGLRRKANACRAHLDMSSSAGLPAVYCDHDQIEHVLQNLVTDAFRRAPSSGSIRVRAETNSLDECVLHITDNGTALEPAQVAHLQSAPFEDTSTRADVDELNWRVAQSLATLNFGRLEISPQPNGGNRVSLFLPIAKPPLVISRYAQWSQGATVGRYEVTVIRVNLLPAPANTLSRAIEGMWQFLLQPNDLVFAHEAGFTLLVCMNPDELAAFPQRIAHAWSTILRSRADKSTPQVSFSVQGTWTLPSQADELCRWDIWQPY